MRIHAVALVLALIALSAPPALAGARAVVPNPDPWIPDREKGERMARELGLPQVILLTLPFHQASWEAYTRLTTDPALIVLLEPFVRMHLEQPDGGWTHQRFRPPEFPCLVMIDASGRTVGQLLIDPHDFRWVGKLVVVAEEVRPRPPLVDHPITREISWPRTRELPEPPRRLPPPRAEPPRAPRPRPAPEG